MGLFSQLFPKIAEKGGQVVLKAKKILIVAGMLVLACILGGWAIFFTHGIIFVSKSTNKNYGPTGVCPYVYSSIGLGGEEKSSIIGALVDTVVGVIYSNDGDNTSGVLKGYRNNILTNERFQVVKMILLVLIIALNGAGFAMGFLKITGGDLLKKMLIVAGFVWATQPGSYELYDQFLEPLVLQGSKEVASFLAGSVMKIVNSPEVIAYADRNFDNEFVLMDGILTIVFSEDLFNKMGALLFTNPAFLFFAPVMYIVGGVLAFYFILFSISIIFYKIVMVVGLSLFPVFVLFGVFKAVSDSFGVASSFFGRYIENTLIKPAISIALLIYGASFLAAIILNYLAGAFSFKVCIKNYFSAPGIISFLGSYDYFVALKPEVYEDLMGTVLAFPIPDEYSAAKELSSKITHPLPPLSNFEALSRMFFYNISMIILLTVIFKKLLTFIESIVNEMEIGSGIASAAGGIAEMAEGLVSKATGKLNEGLTSMAGSWGGKKEEKDDGNRGKPRPDINPLEEKNERGDQPDRPNPTPEPEPAKPSDEPDANADDKNTAEENTDKNPSGLDEKNDGEAGKQERGDSDPNSASSSSSNQALSSGQSSRPNESQPTGSNTGGSQPSSSPSGGLEGSSQSSAQRSGQRLSQSISRPGGGGTGSTSNMGGSTGISSQNNAGGASSSGRFISSVNSGSADSPPGFSSSEGFKSEDMPQDSLGHSENSSTRAFESQTGEGANYDSRRAYENPTNPGADRGNITSMEEGIRRTPSGHPEGNSSNFDASFQNFSENTRSAPNESLESSRSRETSLEQSILGKSPVNDTSRNPSMPETIFTPPAPPASHGANETMNPFKSENRTESPSSNKDSSELPPPHQPSIENLPFQESTAGKGSSEGKDGSIREESSSQKEENYRANEERLKKLEELTKKVEDLKNNNKNNK